MYACGGVKGAKYIFRRPTPSVGRKSNAIFALPGHGSTSSVARKSNAIFALPGHGSTSSVGLYYTGSAFIIINPSHHPLVRNEREWYLANASVIPTIENAFFLRGLYRLATGNQAYGGVWLESANVSTTEKERVSNSRWQRILLLSVFVQISTFIQMRSNLKVVDNSGAKRVMCIQALKGKKEPAAMQKGRCDGSEVKFDDNAVVLVNKQRTTDRTQKVQIYKATVQENQLLPAALDMLQPFQEKHDILFYRNAETKFNLYMIFHTSISKSLWNAIPINLNNKPVPWEEEFTSVSLETQMPKESGKVVGYLSLGKLYSFRHDKPPMLDFRNDKPPMASGKLASSDAKAVTASDLEGEGEEKVTSCSPVGKSIFRSIPLLFRDSRGCFAATPRRSGL
ncbi:ribosomal protein L14, bacterial [Tanacetum coccineum]